MNHPLLEKLETYYIRFKEIGQLITDPEVIQDMERYVRLTKEYKELETITRTADKFKAALLSVEESKDILLHEEDKELREMAEMEIEELEDKLPGMEQELKLLLVPADPDDSKNVILEIRGGTGGDEACLFAGDLFRMYAKFCERKGWKVEVTNANEGTAGGYKEIVASVTGKGVYGIMKYESGVHRVQRVPATETQGRVHTSAATVAVLPEAEAFEVEINEGAIKWDTFRSGGAGGQNVNKVESGVRLRYVWQNPNTGVAEEILIECTETRDQPKNKERALSRLRTFIYDKEHQKLIRQFICRYEKEEQTKICVKEYTDGLQFLEEYEGNLDVVFLDIEMPHMDGMTAARKLREKDTGIKIIFVTNMAQYAIHGYEVDAVDFIVKPISYYVFVDKLKKALRYLNLNKEKMVVVHGNGEMMRIGSSQILYVEKDKNYLVFHTTKGNLQARGTMLDVEKELSQEGFSKCINGCLVNLKCVSKLEKDTVWIDEIQLPISRQRKKEFKEDFMRYLGGDFS